MPSSKEHTDNQRILHERAVALAVEFAKEEGNGEGIDITAFRLGNELYALESVLISEIVELKGATPLPCAPPFIGGIMNLRGRILSLIDLHSLLALKGESGGPDSKVIVLSGGGMEFGLMIDSVEGVQHIPLGSLQSDLPTLEGVGEKYLRGVTAERLILLDGMKLLHDPALVVNEEIA